MTRDARDRTQLPHPGELLRSYYVPDMPLEDYRCLVAHPGVLDVLAERGRITPLMADYLATLFGTSAGLWMNLQRQHEETSQ